ncbi:MAG: hypothetical protein K8R90_05655 [Candidatus Cloacimonetes bacterium]|nr:hypothetical protein [Candidatus Cloacimonadota bacterium]
MKASLWLCAALSLLCVSLSAQNLAEAGWETWRDNSAWFARLDWSASFADKWQAQFVTETEDARDGSFDRDNRVGRYRWQITRRWQGCSGGLVFAVNRLRDSSLSGAGDYRYSRFERSAGLSVAAQPLDGLNLQSEWRWGWQEESARDAGGETAVECSGLRGDTDLAWEGRLGIHRLSASSGLALTGLEQDKSRNWNHFLSWEMPLPRHQLRTRLTLTDTSVDIFQQFLRTDRQQRTVWQAETHYASQALPLVEVVADASFNRLDNRFSTSDNRDYELDQRRLDLRLLLPLQTWNFQMHCGRSFNDRRYSQSANDLMQNEWLLAGTAHWAFTPRDTLRFVRSVRLLRSDTPHAMLPTDNDLLDNVWSLGLRWFVRDRIHLDSAYDFYRTQRVFIDSRMSGNNNTRTRHMLRPTLTWAAGNGWLVEQSYHLLADYDDFRWNLERADRFYRQLSGSMRIAWSQSPSLAGLSGIVWPTLSGVEPLAAWRTEARYAYTHSEGGDWQEEYYEIDDEQERHEAMLSVGQAGWALDWSCEANMSWDMRRVLSLPVRLIWRHRGITVNAMVRPRGDVERLSPGRLEGANISYPRLVREIEWQAEFTVQAEF